LKKLATKKNVIAAKGIKVIPCIQGLGEKEEIVNIFVQHIKDAANDNKIDL
jgi:cobalamin biosynthesis Co2+ chelatase CbiK